jgi:predicted TIM-barrel fold metal-dependent hydrolase
LDPEIARHRLREAGAVALRRGWHVQVYAQLSVLDAVADEMASLGVPVVIDHFGLAHAWNGTQQAGFATLCDLVRGGNAYVKLSAPYRIVQQSKGEDGTPIARALIEANPRRILWGTDWPHTNHLPGVPRLRDRPEPFQPIDDGEQLQIFSHWTTPEERHRILVDNPRSLYGFADGDADTP